MAQDETKENVSVHQFFAAAAASSFVCCSRFTAWALRQSRSLHCRALLFVFLCNFSCTAFYLFSFSLCSWCYWEVWRLESVRILCNDRIHPHMNQAYTACMGAITNTFHHVLYNMKVEGSNEMNKKISASLIHFPRLLFAILFVFIIIMRDEYFSAALFLSLSLALQPMFCISFDFNICVPSGGTELWSWADTTANNGGQRRRTPKK